MVRLLASTFEQTNNMLLFPTLDQDHFVNCLRHVQSFEFGRDFKKHNYKTEDGLPLPFFGPPDIIVTLAFANTHKHTPPGSDNKSDCSCKPAE
jgi:hypothetical protein